jgi:hypothetical protein
MLFSLKFSINNFSIFLNIIIEFLYFIVQYLKLRPLTAVWNYYKPALKINIVLTC